MIATKRGNVRTQSWRENPLISVYRVLWRPTALAKKNNAVGRQRNLGLILKQQWTIEEFSIFRNSSHLEWRAGLSDTILKGTHPRTIPARFGLIWFWGFRGEDLNVKVYDIRRTPSDGKSSHGLWLKTSNNRFFLNCPDPPYTYNCPYWKKNLWSWNVPSIHFNLYRRNPKIGRGP